MGATDNPAEMHSLLKALAPMHIKKGVKVEYLPKFGDALLKTLKVRVVEGAWEGLVLKRPRSLTGDACVRVQGVMQTRFTIEMTSAWEWLWSWISQSFIMSIEDCSTEQTLISQSWDMAMDNCEASPYTHGVPKYREGSVQLVCFRRQCALRLNDGRDDACAETNDDACAETNDDACAETNVLFNTPQLTLGSWCVLEAALGAQRALAIRVLAIRAMDHPEEGMSALVSARLRQ